MKNGYGQEVHWVLEKDFYAFAKEKLPPDKYAELQAILRHSDVSVTQKCYVKTLPKQTVAAMQMLESALCADCAPGAAVFDPKRVN